VHRYRSLSLQSLVVALGLGLAACHADSLPSEPEGRPTQQSGVDAITVPANTWASLTKLPAARVGLVAATVNGVVYAIGGDSVTGYTARVEAFDPNTSTLVAWRRKAPMPAPRAWANGAAVLNGKIYVTGGVSSSGTTKSVYRYDPATDTWVSKAPLPRAGAGGGSAAIDGKLFVYVVFPVQGGYNSALYRYDPATNSWIEREHPILSVEYPAVGAIGGKLFLVGGRRADGSLSQDLIIYDPKTDDWSIKAKMTYPRAFLAARAIDGKLYVAGGTNDEVGHKTGVHERYDPATNSWTTLPSMIVPRMGGGYATAGGLFYVIGGYGYGGDNRLNEAYRPMAD
jgi:N-acetylneuraminic acid mutarotase